MKRVIIAISLFVNICFSSTENSKPYIAVLDFGSPVLSETELISITNQFRSNLVRLNKYTVLNRSKMEIILDEQNFQLSGCTEEACAVEIGKLLSVSHIFFGEIGKIGKTYTIDISSINVETGQIEKSYSKSFIGEKDDFLRILESIAYEISGVKLKKVSSNYKYISSIGAASSAGLGIYTYLQSQNYYKQHQNSTTKSDMERYKELTNKYRNYSQYCAIAAGGFLLYYVVNKVNEKKFIDEKVSIEISGDDQRLCNLKFTLYF